MKTILLKKKLTHLKIAQRVGCSPETISRFKRGYTVSVEMKKAIEQAIEELSKK